MTLDLTKPSDGVKLFQFIQSVIDDGQALYSRLQSLKQAADLVNLAPETWKATLPQPNAPPSSNSAFIIRQARNRAAYDRLAYDSDDESSDVDKGLTTDDDEDEDKVAVWRRSTAPGKPQLHRQRAKSLNDAVAPGLVDPPCSCLGCL